MWSNSEDLFLLTDSLAGAKMQTMKRLSPLCFLSLKRRNVLRLQFTEVCNAGVRQLDE